MNPRHRWTIILGALLLAAAVGFIAYNAGFSSGLEETGKVTGWHGYYHPWGFPFFFPLFFIGFWLLAFRGPIPATSSALATSPSTPQR